MLQADGISKETQFAGLPKAAKIRRDAAHNLNAGSYTLIQCDAVEFNYSSAVAILGAAAGITITEPGLYEIIASGSGAASADYIVRPFVNGAAISILQGWTTGGAFPFFTAVGVVELKTSDIVDLRIFASVLTTISPGIASLYVNKLPGRY